MQQKNCRFKLNVKSTTAIAAKEKSAHDRVNQKNTRVSMITVHSNDNLNWEKERKPVFVFYCLRIGYDWWKIVCVYLHIKT